MFRSIFRSLVTLSVIVLVACGDDSASTPTTPSTPTVTDNFSGTLNPNGARTHPIVAAASGTVTATLTTLTPDSTLRIGLSLGTWNGSACQVIVANDSATQASQVVGQITTVGGNFCVRLYDVGTLTREISYDVSVVHP
ncbi:MAG: hypothetical protein ABR606_03710 [Vicinamibacterales bacterium]